MPLTLPSAPGNGPVAIAFSGGRDSTVLLHLAAHDAALRARGLRALHVDHGLQPRSAEWTTHCAAMCADFGVPFETRRVQVVAGGDGPEAAARDARHAAFARWQAPGETIALAHHRDDQAETVLMRLLRGAGGDGLAGMRAVRPFGRGLLWRPLLDVPAAALAAHAASHALRWVEDPSNSDERFERNHVRRQVMPLLAARWPHAAAGLARSAALLASQAALLAGEDARRLAPIRGDVGTTLDAAALASEAPAWRDRLLRAWVRELGLPPLPADAPATIARDVLDAADDAVPVYAWHGAELRRWGGRLLALSPGPALPPDWRATWDGRTPLTLPTGATLRLAVLGDTGHAAAHATPAFDTPLDVRARTGGERLRLPGRAHRSELKHLYQQRGIAPWIRDRTPLLFAPDGELLAAGDLIMSERLETWLADHGVALRSD